MDLISINNIYIYKSKKMILNAYMITVEISTKIRSNDKK